MVKNPEDAKKVVEKLIGRRGRNAPAA